MTKTIQYRQCRIVKRSESGEMRQMTWIPAEFGIAGRTIKLKQEDGSWEDGWKVVEVGAEASEESLSQREVFRRAFQRDTSKA